MKRWAVFAIGAAVAAIALAHTPTISESVHFRSDAIDFGIPPARLSSNVAEYNSWRLGTDYIRAGGRSYELEERAAAKQKRYLRALVRALHRERSGDYREALGIYTDINRQGLGDAEFVRDRIDLFRSLGGRDVKGLQSYLLATSSRPSGRRLPNTVHCSPVLRPYIGYWSTRYLSASTTRRDLARRYRQIAADYPGSLKAPACLLMSARVLLEEDVKVTASDLRPARESLDALGRRYPKSRFSSFAPGLLARIDYLEGRYAIAIGKYWEIARKARTVEQKRRLYDSILLCQQQLGSRAGIAEALLLLLDSMQGEFDYSLSMVDGVFEKMSAQDAKGFRARMMSNPVLARSYFEYRSGFTAPSPDLIPLARQLGSRDGVILSLAASAALSLGRRGEARSLAIQALRVSRSGGGQARALFVLGSCDQKRGDRRGAIRRYERLIERHPESYLVDGARENLAVLYERSGRMDKALDTYFALNYAFDVAYLLDMRMTTTQIRRYLAAHPSHPQRAKIRFSLGMRYLREEKWAMAEDAFRSLSRKERKVLNRFKEDGYGYWDSDKLHDPLITATELGRLHHKVRLARGPEASAKAMMAVADYYYTRRNLLLYNPSLWNGMRAVAVAYSWNSSLANAQDDKALKRHHYEHECVARTLAICKRIVQKYPKTKTAARAAYRGACAAYRLGDLSTFWRWENRNEDFVAQARSLMLFCSRSKDPKLSKAATKFANVYLTEHKELEKYWLSEYAPGRGPYRRKQW